MSLQPGARLGPYEIVGPLGAGGMGEVFAAVDTRLDRSVAIKILRPESAAAPDRRARFEREARAIASLSHPHICTLHDVGQQDGMSYLVMERLDGETLASRLARGPMPLNEAIQAGVQIADALDRAHRQGIVHRDLKPANIFLTRSGVKLLDFGLARLLTADAPVAGGQTRTGALTEDGIIVGTLQYMAPEQLEGKPTDARTDLFALGTILYEMISGRRAFNAPSQAGLVAAILNAEVPAVTAAPPAIARVVSTCLAKNPDDRWSAAHDVGLLLKSAAVDGGSGAVPTAIPAGSRLSHAGWIVAAVALIALALLGWRSMRLPTPIRPPEVLSIVPPAGTTLTRGEAPQISPDGRQIAFVATDAGGRTMLYVRSRQTGAARAIPGSEDAAMPFWAPDNQRLGFFARSTLKSVALTGGAPRTLAPVAVPRGATWSTNDVILFVPGPNLPVHQLPAAGGAASPLAVSGSGLRWFPSFLPDGRHYLYLEVDYKTRLGNAIRVGSLDSGESSEIVKSAVSAAYSNRGFLLYRRDRALVVQPFDPAARRLTGSATVVGDQVSFSPTGYQLAASAGDGALVYGEQEQGWRLSWFDRHGRHGGYVVPTPGQFNGMCLLRHDTRLVYDLADPSGASTNSDIWLLELATGVTTRLTFDASSDFYPVCAPGGDEVVFASLRDGPPVLFRQLVAAPGSETMVLKTDTPKFPTDWSRDGKTIMYSAHSAKTSWDIWQLTLDGAAPQPVLQTPMEERNGRLSPNGRFLTYTTLQGELLEVFVATMPVSGTRWQVSRGGGQQSVWSADGKTLYYLSNEKKIIAVDVDASGSQLSIGRSRIAVDARVEFRNQGMPFAVADDGSRIVASVASDVTVPITVVVNWLSLVGQ